jgi:hypothetical protein
MARGSRGNYRVFRDALSRLQTTGETQAAAQSGICGYPQLLA